MKIISDQFRKKAFLVVVAILFMQVLVLPAVSDGADLTIEHVKFDDAAPKIILIIRNTGNNKIDVDMIYIIDVDMICINKDHFETAIEIASQSSKKIEQSYEWKHETEYKIRIVTKTGLESEKTVMSPSLIKPMLPISTKAALFAGIVFLGVFVFLVWLGYKADNKLDKGEMRRAIAGMLSVGFGILLILSLVYNIYPKQVVTAYIQLVGIVIGFYFGSKTATEKRAEAATKITIENVMFLDDEEPKKRKMILTIRNGGDTEIKVDKIYVNQVPYETSVKIESQKSEKIEKFHEWEYETEYKIKIATATGFTADKVLITPKKQ